MSEYVKIQKPSSGGGGGDFSDRKSWDPKVTPEIEGEYLFKETDVGQYKSTLYVIKTSDGEDFRVWGSKVLDGLLDEVAIGSKIKIVFLGKKPTKNGMANYKDFDVFLASDSAETPAEAPAEETPAQPEAPAAEPETPATEDGEAKEGGVPF